MAMYEVYEGDTQTFSSGESSPIVALEDFVAYIVGLGADLEDPDYYRVVVNGEQVDFWGDPESWSIIAHPVRLERSSRADRPAVTTRFDLLSLIACAEDYGHQNQVLMHALFSMLGRVTDQEIELFALEKLSPKGREQGYGFEDYIYIITRLREMRDEHGEHAETGTDG